MQCQNRGRASNSKYFKLQMQKHRHVTFLFTFHLFISFSMTEYQIFFTLIQPCIEIIEIEFAILTKVDCLINIGLNNISV